MKIRPLGPQLFHVYGQTGGRTDRTKLRVVFHNLANAPKNDKTERNHSAQKYQQQRIR